VAQIGLIGAGYWGEKWARVLSENDALAWVYDKDSVKQIKVHAKYNAPDPGEPDWDNCDGVIIATPPDTHADLSREALENDVHVLCEKPLALSVGDVAELAELADDRGLVYMAGHTFLYARPIHRLWTWVQEFEEVWYMRFDWLNDGIVRDDVDVLWNVGPHPLSILFFIYGHEAPDVGLCIGSSFLPDNDHADVVNSSLLYPSGLLVDINLSWANPTKEREITVVGSDGKISCQTNQGDMTYMSPEGDTKHLVDTGPEPLQSEFEDFVGCIEQDKTPTSDGWSSGGRVVEWLEILSDVRQYTDRLGNKRLEEDTTDENPVS
jgi:predicted dehydrogenase